MIRTLTVTGTAGTNTVAWDGLDDGGTAVADGTYTYSTSAEDASGDPVGSYHTYRGTDGDKTGTVGQGSTVSVNQDGGKIFSQVLGAIADAIAAMKTDPYDSTAVSDAVTALQEVEEAVEAEMVALSVANLQLERAEEQYTEFEQNMENKLSEEQACDADEVAVKLQTAETAYEVTTEAVAQILNLPNLMSYL